MNQGNRQTGHPFKTKTLNKQGIESNFLNTIKGILKKFMANIILNGKHWKFSPLDQQQDKDVSQLSPLLFNIVLKDLSREIKKKKKEKHPIGKEVPKLYLQMRLICI